MLTTSGPSSVPIELIPPARFRRWAPVSSEPRATANGWAAVCCKRKSQCYDKESYQYHAETRGFRSGHKGHAHCADHGDQQSIDNSVLVPDLVEDIHAAEGGEDVQDQRPEKVCAVKSRVHQLGFELVELEMCFTKRNENTVGCGHKAPEKKHCY